MHIKVQLFLTPAISNSLSSSQANYYIAFKNLKIPLLIVNVLPLYFSE